MLKTIKFIILAQFLFCSFSVIAQSFNYRKLGDTPSFIKEFQYSAEKGRYAKNIKFKNVVDYLPKGYIKTGKIDYTVYIQKALDENRNLIMPDFPVLVNDKGLEVQSKSFILFPRNAKLILSPSKKSNYEVLRIHGRNNIIVFSPNIVGDREHHLNKDGEWGMGISIRGSDNIKVINPLISNCWGDGIYIGEHRGLANKNIDIQYGVIDNNRRNGISVLSVRGLVINNIIISNTNGTNPQAGIDFEPNKNSEILQNITLSNIYTFNNNHQGIFYCLNNLNGSEDPVTISLENHIDHFSQGAIGVMNLTGKSVKNSLSTAVKGQLRFKNVGGRNNKVHFRVFDNSVLDNLQIDVSPNDKRAFKIQDAKKQLLIK